MTRERCIGIELGTSNARVAVLNAAGRPEIVTGPLGERALPAVVAYARRRDGALAVLVGTPARRQGLANPKHTIPGVKRLLGRRADDAAVVRAASGAGFQVVAGPGGTACVEIDGKPTSPEEIASHLFGALKQMAEQALGGSVDRAVLAVSAGAGHAERQALRDAAEIAGLAVDRLISGPTAVGLTAGMATDPALRYAVCDLGGGGLDVSVLNGEAGVLEVLAQIGDDGISGDHLDRRIVERLVAELRVERQAAHQRGGDPQATADEIEPAVLARLRDEAERLKAVLSTEAQTMLQLVGTGGQPHVRAMRRLELEAWVKDVVDQLEAPCRAVLDAAGLAAREVGQLVVVGGAARMPAVTRKLEALFGRPTRRDVHSEDSSVLGAAICAGLRAGLGVPPYDRSPVVALEVTPRALGFDSGGGRFAPVIPRHATLPAREQRIFATERDGQRELAIELYEGDFVNVTRDRRLGRLLVSGLPAGPAGDALALVDLALDVDGRLEVAARELAGTTALAVRLDLACGLDPADVRRLAAARATPG